LTVLHFFFLVCETVKLGRVLFIVLAAGWKN
jgi:hypothetical protein